MGRWLENFKLIFRKALLGRPAGILPHTMAEMLGVDLAVLYAWADPERPEMIPLDKLIKFTRISGDIRPVVAACRMMDGLFIPLKAGAPDIFQPDRGSPVPPKK
ncbi:MAG: hypothetical protein A2X28_00535 [Elusimicrobia bacterium GWA2_56_46]|nr:MAG: hypothetical protein A2X28_00535 [Elusimicrobia bacterium GWA2_56_46]OGR55854.1 MAG: hypothetical protein A2X39_05910 [Elusimicrobia bacterium GWC2_56_31]HBB65964.1 hypothetical protein [Elusimicrobiota bacterium]HBW22213.1 hypothetical protein [Elusimicrobiota bacterium]